VKRLCLVLLVACGSSTHVDPQPPATLPAPELAHTAPPVASASSTAPAPSADPRIAKMLKVVSKARGLAATRPVPGMTLERDALLARVKDHVLREVPHQAIVDEGLVYQLLGQIPTSFDYEKQTFALLEAQLAGYYEPADGTMYLAKDLPGSMAEMTLSHELVHALQDHHFDLKTRSKYMPGQSDLQTATSALAEGDATSAMIDVALISTGKTALDLDSKMFGELVKGSISSGDAGSPRVMGATLVAPYVDGTAFVNTMRARGGWAAVDAVWQVAPVSTEQILHPDKWVAHEAPVTVPPIAIASLGAGWATTQNDVLGELAVRTILEEWLPAQAATSAAANWGGDSAALIKNGKKSAFAWRIRWDAGRPGDQYAIGAFASIVPGAFAKAPIKETTFACTPRADRGPFAAMRKDRDIVIIAGPATTPETGTWTAEGDCKLARTWATEILSK
jgi:hypothetical protein